MKIDDLRALPDAAAKATPGPWHQAGIDNNDSHWMREARTRDNRGIAWCGTNPEREAHRNAAYIAAASPDVVASLARIALAAVQWEHSATSITTWDQFESDERSLSDALRDAGLLTTAPQEPRP